MIDENINKIRSDIPDYVELIAISKTKSNEDIMKAYENGHRSFGENKIQEMSRKFEELPKDIIWPYVNLIHGVDSFKSIKTINKEGQKNNRILNCLLQLKVSKEESKFGLEADALKKIIFSDEYCEMENIKISGIMTMATNTKNKDIVRNEFIYAKNIFDEISATDNNFEILSMGMSNDYQLAIECGSNMIRIGSLIFGDRNY